MKIKMREYMCFVRLYDWIIHLLIGCGYRCEYDERCQECTCVLYILTRKYTYDKEVKSKDTSAWSCEKIVDTAIPQRNFYLFFTSRILYLNCI